MTKPRTIKAWGVFTKRGRLAALTAVQFNKRNLRHEAQHYWDKEFPKTSPHTIRRVTITVEG